MLQGKIAKSIRCSLNSQGWDGALKRRKHGDPSNYRPTAAQHLLHLSRRSQEQGECEHLHDIINQLCDIQGSWLFSLKALRITQNWSQTYCVSAFPGQCFDFSVSYLVLNVKVKYMKDLYSYCIDRNITWRFTVFCAIFWVRGWEC